MKINDKNLNSLQNKQSNKINNQKSNFHTDKTDKSFQNYLSKLSHENIKKQLDEQLEIIERKGKRLKDTLSENNLKEYKRAVKEFLKIIQKKYIKAAQSYDWDKEGNMKTYTLIRKVNENLHNLQALFFKEQAEELGIIEKIDEIRGLLINIYS